MHGWEYDNLFNRVLVGYEQDAINYTLDSKGLNQYAAVEAIAIDYDSNGNLIRQGTRYDTESGGKYMKMVVIYQNHNEIRSNYAYQNQ